MTDFLDPETYDHLCPMCIKTLHTITGLFQDGDMPDTDDDEAPCNYMYDHRMFCGGYTCNQTK